MAQYKLTPELEQTPRQPVLNGTMGDGGVPQLDGI